jgi:hypothetical protein
MTNEYPTFDQLETSTRTTTVYSNIVMDYQKIYHGILITELPDDLIPRTKKRKHIDKKKLVAPRGSILSVQNGDKIRGLDTKTKKTKPKTQPLDYFLNQITILISIGDRILNIMMFGDCLKVVGCKGTDDCIDGINLFFRTYIEDHKDWWKLKDTKTPYPVFCISSVMRNMDFRLGFDIDRCQLNLVMNNPAYEKHVYMSQFETTGHTNVNIKTYGDGEYEFYMLDMKPGEDTVIKQETSNPFSKKKKKKKPYVTFIVFYSSETIISGRSEKAMREKYDFFINVIKENRHLIEDKPK